MSGRRSSELACARRTQRPGCRSPPPRVCSTGRRIRCRTALASACSRPRRELGYSPSALARALVTRRSRIIGVMVGDIVDTYFAEITRGVEDVAGRAGYMTIVFNADRRTELEIEQLAVLSDYQAEGVIFAGSGYLDDPRGDELGRGRGASARARHQRARARHARLRCPAHHGRQQRRGLSTSPTTCCRSAIAAWPTSAARPALYASRDRLEGFRAAMTTRAPSPGRRSRGRLLL